MRIAVPAYFYPDYQDPIWGAMQTSFPTCRLAVANINSGPGGPTIDTNYQSQVVLAQQAGLTVVGYVDSAYATKSLANFRSEVDAWFELYTVTGIFVDDVTTDCLNSTYYTAIYDYVKSYNTTYTVIINPGAIVPFCFEQVGDIIVNFEGNISQYDNWQPAGWETNYSSYRFWHIIHSAPQSALDVILDVVDFRNAGYVYVTDAVLPNPYGRLSSYWYDEVLTLQSGAAVTQISVILLFIGLFPFM
jgi:hypothetical protein